VSFFRRIAFRLYVLSVITLTLALAILEAASK
jgi:hypothetical protein